MKIDKIVANIYDPTIETQAGQPFLSSVIKAWLKDAISQGIALGREDLALEIEKTI